jgi:hypothetical protein
MGLEMKMRLILKKSRKQDTPPHPIKLKTCFAGAIANDERLFKAERNIYSAADAPRFWQLGVPG